MRRGWQGLSANGRLTIGGFAGGSRAVRLAAVAGCRRRARAGCAPVSRPVVGWVRLGLSVELRGRERGTGGSLGRGCSGGCEGSRLQPAPYPQGGNPRARSSGPVVDSKPSGVRVPEFRLVEVAGDERSPPSGHPLRLSERIVTLRAGPANKLVGLLNVRIVCP
jgi:hypothetical protein